MGVFSGSGLFLALASDRCLCPFFIRGKRTTCTLSDVDSQKGCLEEMAGVCPQDARSFFMTLPSMAIRSTDETWHIENSNLDKSIRVQCHVYGVGMKPLSLVGLKFTAAVTTYVQHMIGNWHNKMKCTYVIIIATT